MELKVLWKSNRLIGPAAFCAALFLSAFCSAKSPIKVGILHSLSGTMAISEAPLKDTLLMLIQEQNRKGGLLGRPLQAVVVDPGSDDAVFAAKARELIISKDVDVVFGCWTSASRKAVLPIFEKLNSLLFYPVQYEAEESSRNVFYFGAAPNQQAIPAVDFLMSDAGGAVRRWALVGTDYVYPRTTNKILRAYLRFRGVSGFDIIERYTPFGHRDWRDIIREVRDFSAVGLKTAVISTVNGDANIYFFKELAHQGIDPKSLPVMAFSIGESELSALNAQPLVGHLAAWNYFMSIDTPENEAFINGWRAYTGNKNAVTNDPMEAHYIGFQMWVDAVKQVGTTEVDAVRKAMYGRTVRNLTGSLAVMNSNHHLSKPVYVGKIQASGQFDLLWSISEPVRGDAWSDFILDSAKLTADWTYPWLCGGCERPTFGQTGK